MTTNFRPAPPRNRRFLTIILEFGRFFEPHCQVSLHGRSSTEPPSECVAIPSFDGTRNYNPFPPHRFSCPRLQTRVEYQSAIKCQLRSFLTSLSCRILAFTNPYFTPTTSLSAHA